MKRLKGVLAILALFGIGFVMSSCEGGCEKAGRDIDRAVEKAGDKIEDATDRPPKADPEPE